MQTYHFDTMGHFRISPRVRNSTVTAIRHLSHNNCKEDSIYIFQRAIINNTIRFVNRAEPNHLSCIKKSSNTAAIEHAIETKKWLDSMFALPEDIQTTPISEVARTENEVAAVATEKWTT
ncbi:unnamed protein product [Cuscuta campestris]|uniref:Uncharacterized protein n=1 Tax=Cuscuta campestris TaxID=132261 RepID=A0A484NHJ1_9ASTE|nr:unnamed protein product [Cuscuta campestris]